MIHKLEPLIYIITGPMYSSKTKELLAQMERYKFADCKYQIFKPTLDNRYSETEIIDHSKRLKEKVTVVKDSKQLLEKLKKNVKVIGIDEVHFFDSEIVNVLFELREKGIVIYAAGLDTDFRKIPFAFSDGKKNMGHLLAIADFVDKKTAVCPINENGTVCGSPARYTCRLSKSKDLILVGSIGDYISTCHKHHKIPE